ncbi:MAG: aminoacyl-histidine dipeptidase [Pirellulaceae bacterium]
MSEQVRQLEPAAVWNHFADLNEVPRASKKEERVIEFASKFGQQLGLETVVDDVGNVIIRKPASAGHADRLPIVMQSHLDMVHQKNSDTDFDFDTQGIDMQVDGDWVQARGTTLGADNGIGVASIMTVLASDEIEHPPLEALFTIDEETGMTGAKGLEGGMLHGKVLLNLDTEEDDELTIGCAGGVDITATRNYSSVPTPQNMTGFRIAVQGLKGGHSGVDIHLGRANANKIMNRILWQAAQQFGLRIAEIDGGGLRNAIPRESFAVVAVPESQKDSMTDWLAAEAVVIVEEYKSTDPDAVIEMESCEAPTNVLTEDLQRTLMGVLYLCPNGIHRMSPEVEDLVQTSNNLARVLVKDGSLTIGNLTRSSVNSERDDLASAITAGMELLDVDIELGGKYPGWQPQPDSMIVKLMSQIYEDMYGAAPHVAACHAGLECGLIGTNYPDMQMISFGPTIRGAHSPDEKVQISSVQKYWKFLLETLKRIPAV